LLKSDIYKVSLFILFLQTNIYLSHTCSC